ncbi:winged helix-turn-helix domain-containing protein [Streptomyces sp. BRA346]
MRYPDGGGLTAKQRARRVHVRFRVAELFARGVAPPRVARRLRVSRRSVYAWHARWREAGVQALRSKGPSGRSSRTKPGWLDWLAAELEEGPGAHGWVEGQRWMLARVVTVIARRFHVRFRLAQTWRILRRMGFTVQVPARRAAERDEEAVAAWIKETWPRVGQSARELESFREGVLALQQADQPGHGRHPHKRRRSVGCVEGHCLWGGLHQRQVRPGEHLKERKRPRVRTTPAPQSIDRALQDEVVVHGRARKLQRFPDTGNQHLPACIERHVPDWPVSQTSCPRRSATSASDATHPDDPLLPAPPPARHPDYRRKRCRGSPPYAQTAPPRSPLIGLQAPHSHMQPSPHPPLELLIVAARTPFSP